MQRNSVSIGILALVVVTGLLVSTTFGPAPPAPAQLIPTEILARATFNPTTEPPTPTRPPCDVTFTGYVYEGYPTDTSRPLSGVTVRLREASSGNILDTDRTNSRGRYRLSTTTITSLGYEIVETDPRDYTSTGARAGRRGRVIDSNRIRYDSPDCGTYSDNNFWDAAEARCDLPLTVNTTDDLDDGSCDAPHCSLREAINCANSRSGPDTISFDIPASDAGNTGFGWVITPASELPTLTDGATTIDGTTQADANSLGPDVAVAGTRAGAANGFNIAATNSVIRGLTIGGFELSGVRISRSGRSNNTIQDNYIGVAAIGTEAFGNGRHGVEIVGGAQGTQVTDNAIGGNQLSGVWIGGDRGFEKNNVVSGNKIGAAAAGTGAIPNGAGVSIDGAHHNTVGPNNAISGNSGHGIYLFGGAHDNTIGPRNDIANNTGDGVRVDGQATLGNTITQNSITENGGPGIENIGGGNTELPPPVFGVTSATEASGTASLPGGGPCAGCTIEVFSDQDDEGRQFLGSGTTETDGSWSVTFTTAPGFANLSPTSTEAGGSRSVIFTTAPALANLSATSTDTDGNTSEFSFKAGHGEPPEGETVEVTKELILPPGGVIRVDEEEVHFKITIRNTGDTNLTRVRVVD